MLTDLLALFRNKVFLVVLGIGLSISIAHYATPLDDPALHYLHDTYRRLYYIPIIVGALFLRLRGGMFISILISLLYLPHALEHQLVRGAHSFPEQLVEIVFFNLFAFIIGYFAEKEVREKNKTISALSELRETHSRLKHQTEINADMQTKMTLLERLSVLGELSANLAHEIRNPLGSIQGVAEILHKKHSSDEKDTEFTSILLEEVNRLNSVVEGYTGFVRKNGDTEKAVDPEALLSSTLQLLKIRLERYNIEVKIHNRCRGSIRIKIDPNEMIQVLVNLLLNASNAIKRKSYTGRIDCGLYTKDGYFVYEITDNGIGIGEKDLAEIFKPFFSKTSDGTGLGLSISKRIVEKYRGQIIASSKINHGSAFSVLLPLSN